MDVDNRKNMLPDPGNSGGIIHLSPSKNYCQLPLFVRLNLFLVEMLFRDDSSLCWQQQWQKHPPGSWGFRRHHLSNCYNCSPREIFKKKITPHVQAEVVSLSTGPASLIIWYLSEMELFISCFENELALEVLNKHGCIHLEEEGVWSELNLGHGMCLWLEEVGVFESGYARKSNSRI